MAPLIRHHDTREAPEHLPGTHDTLPELPAGVTVPEDLSTLELPASSRPTRAETAVRWLRWIPVVAVLIAGAVLAAVLLTDGGTDIRPSNQTMTAMDTIQAEIDSALAEQSAAQLVTLPSAAEMIQAEIDEALWLQDASAAEIIRFEIDQALAEFEAREALLATAARAQLPVTPAAGMIQAEIDEALWLQDASAAEIIQHEIDEALSATVDVG